MNTGSPKKFNRIFACMVSLGNGYYQKNQILFIEKVIKPLNQEGRVLLQMMPGLTKHSYNAVCLALKCGSVSMDAKGKPLSHKVEVMSTNDFCMNRALIKRVQQHGIEVDAMSLSLAFEKDWNALIKAVDYNTALAHVQQWFDTDPKVQQIMRDAVFTYVRAQLPKWSSTAVDLTELTEQQRNDVFNEGVQYLMGELALLLLCRSRHSNAPVTTVYHEKAALFDYFAEMHDGFDVLYVNKYD